MMGLPEGWVSGPLTNRSKALNALGNGVVPQQAALAYAICAGPGPGAETPDQDRRMASLASVTLGTDSIQPTSLIGPEEAGFPA